MSKKESETRLGFALEKSGGWWNVVGPGGFRRSASSVEAVLWLARQRHLAVEDQGSNEATQRRSEILGGLRMVSGFVVRVLAAGTVMAAAWWMGSAIL